MTEVPGISDAEFAKKAEDTCNDLMKKLKQIISADQQGDPEIVSAAYRQAADALGELHFTAQSAPLGYQLQTNMAQYAEVSIQYKSALQKAKEEAGWDGIGLMSIDKDYTIHFVEKNSKVGWVQLNIDSELVKQFHTSRDAFLEAATQLGLNGCAPTEADLNN